MPTLSETGLPDAESYAWIGLVEPAATPVTVAARLAEQARAALADPRTRGVLERRLRSSPQALGMHPLRGRRN